MARAVDSAMGRSGSSTAADATPAATAIAAVAVSLHKAKSRTAIDQSLRLASRPVRRPAIEALLADLFADSIFLLVEGLLLLLGNMTAILACHRLLFLANLPVILVQRSGLGFAYLACLHFLVNALVLVCEALVHFGAAGMVFLPLRLREGASCRPEDKRRAQCKRQGLREIFAVEHV